MPEDEVCAIAPFSRVDTVDRREAVDVDGDGALELFVGQDGLVVETDLGWSGRDEPWVGVDWENGPTVEHFLANTGADRIGENQASISSLIEQVRDRVTLAAGSFGDASVMEVVQGGDRLIRYRWQGSHEQAVSERLRVEGIEPADPTDPDLGAIDREVAGRILDVGSESELWNLTAAEPRVLRQPALVALAHVRAAQLADGQARPASTTVWIDEVGDIRRFLVTWGPSLSTGFVDADLSDVPGIFVTAFEISDVNEEVPSPPMDRIDASELPPPDRPVDDVCVGPPHYWPDLAAHPVP